MSARWVMLGWGGIKCYMTAMNALTFPPPKHQRARLSVADFTLLHSSGAFEAHAKSELIGGEIYVMNAQYRRHLMAKTDLFVLLHAKLIEIGSTLRAVPEGSVHFSDHDLPEPDIVLTSAAYGEGAIPGASVVLIIEVADSTQRMDFGKKLRLYAKAQIAEYWVLDTQTCIAHQHWQPKGTRYLERREVAFGQAIAAETIADLTVTLPE